MWIGSMQTSASTAVDSSVSRCSWLLTWTQGDRLRSSCDALCLHWDAGCHPPHPRDVSRMIGKLNKGHNVCYFQSLKTGYYFSRRGHPQVQPIPSLVRQPGWWTSPAKVSKMARPRQSSRTSGEAWLLVCDMKPWRLRSLQQPASHLANFGSTYLNTHRSQRGEHRPCASHIHPLRCLVDPWPLAPPPSSLW